MKRALLAGVAVLAGAYCAAAAEFYVVQDTASTRCQVVAVPRPKLTRQ